MFGCKGGFHLISKGSRGRKSSAGVGYGGDGTVAIQDECQT